MIEYNNRVSAQSEILNIVNSLPHKEELYGLSSGALARFGVSNDLPDDSRLMTLLKESAALLFFLANKSQEHITEEYKLKSIKVAEITQRIRALVKHIEA